MTLELLVDAEPFAWETSPAEVDREILDGAQFAGLTLAEQKALAITSTLETGQRGGFFGLTGNSDGMGLSFGLVNWNIGSGSLQPLLLELIERFPDRWTAALRGDAEHFEQILKLSGPAAKVAQLTFVIDEMNRRVYNPTKKRMEWAIVEPWRSHFGRLAKVPELQAIQVRFARDLLNRAQYFCDYFGLRTERAFCMMFDAVASHGKWWLTKKNDDGVQWRRDLLRNKLDELATAHGGKDSLPEHAKLRAIAATLGETSRKKYRARVLARKLWFLTGEHKRAAEIRGLEPTDAPFTTSDATSPATIAAPVPAKPPGSPSYDPTIDMAVITAFMQGIRDHEDLTDAVFFQRHAERKGTRIGPGETAARDEWRAIRARVTQLFPKLDASPELELAPETEDAVVTPIVTMLLAKGERDPTRLASEAFYALNPERKRAPIRSGETTEVAQWRRLRRGIVKRLLNSWPATGAATGAAIGDVPRLVRSEDSSSGRRCTSSSAWGNRASNR